MTVFLCTSFPTSTFAQISVETSELEFLTDTPTKNGKLINIDRQQIQLNVEGQTETFACSDIDKLTFESSTKKFKDPIIVTLFDGSQIWTDELSMADDQWSLNRGGDELIIEPGLVSQILFRSPTQQEIEDWESISQSSRSNDSLVISRSSGVVDQIDGLVIGVNENTVDFDFDGQVISAPRNKLLGAVIYRRLPERVSPAPLVNLTDSSSIRAEKLGLDAEAGKLQIGLLNGKAISVSISSVANIDFAAANVRWLADVPLLDSRLLSGNLNFSNTSPDGETSILTEGLAPLFVTPSNDRAGLQPIDLKFRQPTMLEFRVPEGFSRFSCSISRDVVGESISPLVVRLELAGREIVSQKLPMTENPIDISVDVEADKRLRLIVECENSLPVGSSTIWKQPRFIR